MPHAPSEPTPPSLFPARRRPAVDLSRPRGAWPRQGGLCRVSGPLATAFFWLAVLVFPFPSTGLAAQVAAVGPTPTAPPQAVPDVDALRREMAAQVTQQTRDRLVRLQKNKAMTATGASVRQARLNAASDPAYLDLAARDAHDRLRTVLGPDAPSQYFVYVDRNPDRQLILLGLYDQATGRVEFLGGDLVSTGLLRKGEDSFLTPTGVFEHLPANFGYRAQGTKNQYGWRGLGGKGSRVWDFGFQLSPREFRQGVFESQMRLLMHATDPDQGEPRLGRMDSKGCVRVSAAMNRFLDRHGVLDRHYERLAAEKPDMWLLAPDRTPVSAPGSFMVVGDTSQTDSVAR